MSQSDRAKRLAKRVATAPHVVLQTHERTVAVQDELASIHHDINQVRATLDSASNAQMEALAFITRALNDISARLAKLEKDRAGSEPT
jgi:hypothetical protein